MPAALEHLALNYGRLPLSDTLEAAIRHAKTGFETDEHYRRMAAFREKALEASADAAKIFLENGRAPDPGTLIVQPDLADTLSEIASKGAKGFYQGKVAARLVESVKRHGGVWRMEDLASYRAVERRPISGEYAGMKIVSAAPPSSGGIALVQMLNMLAQFDLEPLAEGF